MTKVPFTKPALTYAEQLQRLKLRGLIFINEPKVLHLLEKISYYRLSGYLYPMIAEPKADHIFKPGSTFNNGFKLYCFDRELRKLIPNIRDRMKYLSWNLRISTLIIDLQVG